MKVKEARAMGIKAGARRGTTWHLGRLAGAWGVTDKKVLERFIQQDLKFQAAAAAQLTRLYAEPPRGSKPTDWTDPSIKVTKIKDRWHARLLYKGEVRDELACDCQQDIGLICKEMLRWFDKLGGTSVCMPIRLGTDNPLIVHSREGSGIGLNCWKRKGNGMDKYNKDRVTWAMMPATVKKQIRAAKHAEFYYFGEWRELCTDPRTFRPTWVYRARPIPKKVKSDRYNCGKHMLKDLPKSIQKQILRAEVTQIWCTLDRKWSTGLRGLCEYSICRARPPVTVVIRVKGKATVIKCPKGVKVRFVNHD